MNSGLKICQNLTNPNEKVQLLARLLMPFSTLILLKLYWEELQLTEFQDLFLACCEEILAGDQKARGIKKITQIKTQVTSIFSRFLILEPENISQFLESNLNLQEFLRMWLEALNSVTSSKSTWLNCLALLRALEVFKLEAIIPNFEKIVSNVVGQLVVMESEEKEKKIDKVITTGMRKRGYSAKKKELHKLQLYENVQLVEIFRNVMRVIL